MEILYWDKLKELPPEKFKKRPVAISMGVFDGFHKGHQSLITKVLMESSGESLVVTFKDNPKKILLKDKYTGDLTTLEDKLRYMEAMGIHKILIIDFSHEFSTMTGREFISHLYKYFEIQTLVIGYDFSFGKGAQTGAKELKDLVDSNTSLFIVPPVYEGEMVISSTLIRKLLTKGLVSQAVSLLGHSYKISLGPKAQRVFDQGIWTARREDFLQILPHEGVFSCETNLGDQVTMDFKQGMVHWNGSADRECRDFFLK